MGGEHRLACLRIERTENGPTHRPRECCTDNALSNGAKAMATPFLAVPLAFHLIAASSGGVPTLDVRPSCRAAAAAAQIANRVQACIETEQAAREQLVKTWTKFDVADRSSCVGTIMDFEPTYTELLTCLEMASDARKLPDELY